MEENSDEWKDVPDYEGFYKVSRTGIVKSVERWITNSNGIRSKYKGVVRKLTTDRDGYGCVILHREGERKSHRISRIVAICWVPNPNYLPEVRYLDDNRDNTVPENLEWCLHSDAKRSCTYKKVTTEIIENAIGMHCIEKYSYTKISQLLEVDYTTLRRSVLRYLERQL